MGSNNFSTGEQHAIFGVSTAFSILSLIGALSIVFSYYKFPKLRKFSFKLVLFMSITDGFSCISYFLGSPTTDTALCTLQGFLQQRASFGKLQRSAAASGLVLPLNLAFLEQMRHLIGRKVVESYLLSYKY